MALLPPKSGPPPRPPAKRAERYPGGVAGSKIVRPGDARGASELAAAARTAFPPHIYIAWLHELAAGRDPACTLDPETGERLPPEKQQTYVPVDAATRRWALEAIGNRAWGREKQIVELAGEVVHSGSVQVDARLAVLSVEVVRQAGLSAAELEAARSAERKLLEAAAARRAELEAMPGRALK